jgi:pyruvate dehydrogenase E2 component (dihydrolipoamide acetyltransferase)
VAASPLAKTLASQRGIDIRQVAGTGPGGRIIAADVREFAPSAAGLSASAPAPRAGAGASHALAVPTSGAGFTDFPLSESAKAIAPRLTVAKQVVPHYYLTVDVLLDRLLSTRARLNADLPEGEKLSVHDFLLKAAALACKQVPDANASWHGDFVRHYHSVDVNVAVGVGDGLLAPVVRGVDTKGLRAVSKELRAAAAGAESGSLAPEALATGTITVINVGLYGVRSVAPIVSLPQAVALGVGAIENRVVPRASPKEGEDVYEVKPGVTVTLSCDHRVIDGAVGAQWLSVFKGLVEDPATLLL